jgi:acyl-CoA thioesterase FadM
MKFVKEYTTRWHDTDAKRTVRPTQLLVYMQETSNAHLDSTGHNLDRLRDEHALAFLLSKTRIALYAPLYAHERITVETFTAESRAFGFNRYYRILRGDEVIAAADTTWALIDLNTRQLCKADAFDFGFEHEQPIDIGLPPRFRIPHTDELELLGERRIVYSDLDYNMHMNNTRYADMLCDYMPLEDIPKIKGISLSYLHEAAFGDTVKVYTKKTDGRYSFRTVNQNGVTCLEAEVLI